MKKLVANDLLPGDVLLYRAANAWKNAMSVMIRALDGTQVSHAGLYMGDNLVGESLIFGNPGLNTNPLNTSIGGCNWVEVRRLISADDLGLVIVAANKRLAIGGRYGFDQILLVAALCVTRQLDLGDGLLRKIVYGVLQKANKFVRSMTLEGREPMICSEFVYRAYDEAMLEEDDQYSLAILSQSDRAPKKRWGTRRLQEKFFAASPEQELPTIEPGSLLAESLDEPQVAQQSLSVTTPFAPTDAELDAMIYQWTGEPQPLKAGGSAAEPSTADAGSVPEVSVVEVKLAARDFLNAVADAPIVEESDRQLCRMAPSSASPAQRALPIIADYVTPGDLLLNPSLETVGRLHP